MLNYKKFISKYFSTFLFFLIFSLSIAELSFGQPVIQIDVHEPSKDGQEVGMRTMVKGTAIIPKNNFLWILAHRIKDHEDSWWPQGVIEIDPQNPTWTKYVRFGEERDIGYQFEIAVITVAKEEHEKLNRYWFMVKNTGRSNPIKMPPTTSPPTYRIVKKVSHEK